MQKRIIHLKLFPPKYGHYLIHKYLEIKFLENILKIFLDTKYCSLWPPGSAVSQHVDYADF